MYRHPRQGGGDMTVAQILKEKGGEVIGIAGDASIAEAADLLARHGIGALIVRDGRGGVAGILSERDIVRGLARDGAALLSARVDEAMTRDVVTAAPGESIGRVRELMTEGRFRHLPVMEDGRLVGLISIGDVVKHRIREAELEASALKDYIRAG